jgi:hypothetical protein
MISEFTPKMCAELFHASGFSRVDCEEGRIIVGYLQEPSIQPIDDDKSILLVQADAPYVEDLQGGQFWLDTYAELERLDEGSID